MFGHEAGCRQRGERDQAGGDEPGTAVEQRHDDEPVAADAQDRVPARVQERGQKDEGDGRGGHGGTRTGMMPARKRQWRPGGGATVVTRLSQGQASAAQSEAIRAAVSHIRFEKPHSLSYHEATRQSLPPITLVALRSTVELAGLWLKSIETRGSS